MGLGIAWWVFITPSGSLFPLREAFLGPGVMLSLGLGVIAVLAYSLITGSLGRKKAYQQLVATLEITNRHVLSQERARILEVSLDLVATLDAKGELRFANMAWQHRLGYASRTVLGRALMEFVHPTDRHLVKQTLDQLTRGESAPPFETRLLTAHGEQIWVSWQITLDTGAKLFYGIGRDITDNHYRREEQAAALGRYTALVAALGDIAYELHLDTRRIQWSGNYSTLLGYSQSAMGRQLTNWRQRIHPDDLGTVENAFSQVDRNRRLLKMEYRVRHAAGNYLWIQEQTVILFTGKHPSVAMGMLKDISAQKAKEEVIHQTGLANQPYWDQMGGMLLVAAADGQVLRVNRRTCQVLGYSEVELLGSGWFEHCVPMSQRVHRARYLARVMDGSEMPPDHYESVVLDCQGQERLIRWHGTLLESEIGKRIGVVLIGQDLTEQLPPTSLPLNEAGMAPRTQQALVTHISHEMRTPLTTLLGFAEQLQVQNQTASEREKALQAVLVSGQRLQRLVTDILDLSEAEGGQLTITSGPVDLPALLNGWFVHFNPLAQAKGLKLAVQPITPLPRTFTSDSQRLTQLLNKLGDNAVRFTDQGTIHLLVSCDPAEEHLVLSLFDSGRGISPTQAERMFQPFTQGDESLSRDHGGLGIGLSLARRLAQRLGGDLQLHSHVGVGSLFIATVTTGPLDTIALDAVLDLPNPTEVSPTALSIPLVMGRILLAEDNEYNQTLITYHLAKTGAEVTAVANGEEAVSQAMEQDFQLIVMDMQMPVMGGLEATKMLRDALYPGPIIALTAHGQSYHRQEALEVGCNEFLTKPVNWSALYLVVARYLPAANGITPSSPTIDNEVITALAVRFQEDLPITLLQLAQALEKGDLTSIGSLAHQIKGVAASLGYPALGATARVLENAARAGDSQGTAEALRELRDVAKSASTL